MGDYLGRMLLMTIREDVHCPWREFDKAWEAQRLPIDHKPRQRTPEDAFRRATPRKQWREGMALLDYKGQQQCEDGAALQAVLVHSRDSRQKVDIHHANRAVVYLMEDAIKTLPLTPLLPKEQSFVDEVSRNYELRLNHVDGSQLRSAIMRVLNDVSAIAYRDGSYLVPAKHFETVDAVIGLVAAMQEHSDHQHVVWDIPYVNTDLTRSQLRTALGEHIERVAKSVMHELGTLKQPTRNRKVTRRDSLMAQLGNLQRVIDTYAETLGESLPQHRLQLQQAIREAQRV